jgi:hypothetical protein
MWAAVFLVSRLLYGTDIVTDPLKFQGERSKRRTRVPRSTESKDSRKFCSTQERPEHYETHFIRLLADA